MIFSELKPGKTVEAAEIKAYKTEEKSSHYIYLLAGVHGNEVEGIHILKEIFNWLKTNDQIDLPFVIIPILNIDGYRMGTRVNSHGVDLNRNLDSSNWTSQFKEKKYCPGDQALSEPENKYLVKLFNKYTPKIVISFHSWKPMLNYNGDCLDVVNFLNQHNNYQITDDIGYSTPGSLGSYLPEKLQAPVVTYECPTITNSNKTLKDIWHESEKALKELFLNNITNGCGLRVFFL